MGFLPKRRLAVRAAVVFGLVGVFLLQSSGCYYSPSVARKWARQAQREQALQEERELATGEQTGLDDPELIAPLKVALPAPASWGSLPLKKTALYSHQQWRSPSKKTGVGVVYVRLPMPLPMSTLTWFAKQEYTKKADDGRLINEWTDSVGRHWFEAENNKYHVKGYAVVSGLDAWFVYSGYRVAFAPETEQLALAEKSMQAIRPVTGDVGKQTTASAQ